MEQRARLLPEGQTIEYGGQQVRIGRCISTAGAMGEIYEGYLIRGGDEYHVAIKAMRWFDDPDAETNFNNEALYLSQLNGIEEEASKEQGVALKIAPRYYFKGEYEYHNKAIPYLVMEFIEGQQITSLLSTHEKLPEPEVLALGWHLYWLLNLLHTRLRRAYRDLKFENLWRAESGSGGILLRVTDLGGLEEIREGQQGQRSIQRDLLLGGIYLCAMLTGHTPAYSYGRLGERIEPILQGTQGVSWGARWVLRWLLHRNPDMRPRSASEVANELQNLSNYWQRSPTELLSIAQKLLDRAAEEMESDQGTKKDALRYAARARAALDIVKSGGSVPDDWKWTLNAMLERAESLLSSSSYIERGKALLRGGSFTEAHRVFVEGQASADNPVILRRYSYLAKAGEEAGLSKFQSHVDEAIRAVDEMNQGLWSMALERLEGLQGEPRVPALDALIADCQVYQSVEQGEKYVRDERFSEAAEAYREALQNLNRLPEADRQLAQSEEVGDLRARVEELTLLAQTREKAREQLSKAKEYADKGDIKNAIGYVREAFSSDRELDELPVEVEKIMRQVLLDGNLSAAIQLARIGLRATRPNAALKVGLRLASYLQDAQEALENRDWQGFEDRLGQAISEVVGYPGHDLSQTIVTPIRRAVEIAQKEQRFEILRRLSDVVRDQLGSSEWADQIRKDADSIAEAHKQRISEAVKRLVEEAIILLNLDDPLGVPSAVDRYPTFTEALRMRRARLERLDKVEELLREARAIAPDNDPCLADISSLEKRVERERGALEDYIRRFQEEEQAQKQVREELIQRWKSIQGELQVLLQPGTLPPGAPARAEWLNQMAGEIGTFMSACYAYLDKVGDDREIVEFLEQARKSLLQLGPGGLRWLLHAVQSELTRLQQEVDNIHLLYEDGELQEAIEQLVALEQRYGSTLFAIEEGLWLDDLKRQLLSAEALQRQEKEKRDVLNGTQYDEELISQIGKYADAGFPKPYLKGFIAYLQRLEESSRIEIERIALDRRRWQANADRMLEDIVTLAKQWLKTAMTLRRFDDKGARWDVREWEISPLLENLYKIVRGKKEQAKRLADLLATLPTPPDLNKAIDELTPSALKKEVKRLELQQRRTRHLVAMITGLAALVVCTALFVLTYPPVPVPPGSLAAELDELLHGTYTPSPTSLPTPTFTPIPSATSSPTPSPTLTPTASPTLLPFAGYILTSPEEVIPPVPVQGPFMQLLTYENAEALPPFSDSRFWSLSRGDVTHYYTVADSTPGQLYLNWPVGQLDAGTYQLYVLDTVSFSEGEHAFQVWLGSVPVKPFRGTSHIIFESDQTRPPQQEKVWLPIGSYEVKYGQYMSVAADSTSLAHQNFAASRLLIIKLRDDDVRILEGLPSERPLEMLLDDIYVKENPKWESSDSADAWNGSYKAFSWDGVGPQQITFIWEGHGILTPGQYELLVHLPHDAKDVKVKYDLLQNGQEVKLETPRDESQGVCTETPSLCSEGWVSWGIWTLRNEGRVSIRLTALGSGRIVADAVALVRATDMEGN